MDITAYLHVLIFLMIIAALIAVETSNLLSSIISMGAIGFLLSIAFLLLGAPDIAITQIVVEIIVLIILIRATINRDLTAISGDREFFGLLVTIALIFILSLISIRQFTDLPLFGVPVLDRIAGVPSHAYLSEASKNGSNNVVQTILLNFRGYDTLGVMAVFFCAMLGAYTLLRRKGRKHIHAPDTIEECYESTVYKGGMSLIVKTVTRGIEGFLLLFGIYLVLYSHTFPGGGFTGGVIIACSFILITLAEGQKTATSVFSKITAGVLTSVGALIVLGTAIWGQLKNGVFFSHITKENSLYLKYLDMGTVQVCDIGIGLMVGSALYLIFSIMALLHVRVKNDGERDIIQRKQE